MNISFLFLTYFLILINLLISGCTKNVYLKSPSFSELSSKFFNYPQTIESYLEMSHKEEGEDKVQALLQTAGKMIQEGYQSNAEQILTSLPTPASIKNSNHKILLQAQLSLFKKKSQLALQQLAQINTLNLNPEQISQYHYLLSIGYAQQLDYLNSALILMKLTEYSQLTDQVSQKIFQNLYRLPISELNTLSLEYQDPIIKSWIDLTLIFKQHLYENKLFSIELNRWANQYLNIHSFAEQYIKFKEATLLNNKNIALLLPLSGPFEKAGQTIKESFIKIYKEKFNNSNQITSYDTNNTEDISQLYQQAVSNGANIIIGPIEHQNIEKLIASRREFPITTIFLNYVENQQWSHSNVYQFSLNPKEEAKAVAAKILEDGYRRPLVVFPKNLWGQSIRNAFIEKWRESGSEEFDELMLNESIPLHQDIQHALKIIDSYIRKKEVQSIFPKLYFYPRRRQDIDSIFLVAKPSLARQINPLLSFYYAGDLPVYATSSVFTGYKSATEDGDLENIIFCDMPYVAESAPQKKFEWPEYLNSKIRLQAIGKDTFLILLQLEYLKKQYPINLPGLTGYLELNPKNRIIRTLEWSQFRKGIPNNYL